MSITCSKMVPIATQRNNEEDLNVHPHLRNLASPSEDTIKYTLDTLNQGHGPSQSPTTSTPTKPKATRSFALTECNPPSIPKLLGPSFLAPVLVSPTVSDISHDSFEDEGHTWDTPLDGKGRLAVDDTNDVTPLTPPPTHKRPRSGSFEDAESPLLRKARSQAHFKAETAPKTETHDTDRGFDVSAVKEDYFSNPLRPIFRVNTLCGEIEKNQPREKFANKPVTNFTQSHKIIIETESLESTSIKKSVTSEPTIHASVESERRSTIKYEQARSTDESVARSTTSVKIKAETTVPALGPQHSPPFGNREGLCVALTKLGERCKRQAGKPDLVWRSLRALATHYNSKDHEAFAVELETFINVALCKRSHRGPASQKLEITHQTSSGKNRCQISLVDLFGADDAEAFSLWANTEKVVIEKRESSIETPSISTTIATNIESHTTLNAGPISTSVSSTMKVSVATTTGFGGFQPFQPFQPRKTKDLLPNVALEKLIEKELTPTDLKSGFIYLFWEEGMSWGHLKIGRSINPQKRLEQWNKQCKRTHMFVDNMVKVPHVSRVEILMHTELKDVRKSIKCAGCQRVHREWFEVSQSHAKKVFKKWQAWINQHPYEMDHTGKWALKPASRTTIADVCEPVPLETKSQKPIGPRKHNSPPRRKVSNAHNLFDRGRMTEIHGSLSGLKVPGDGPADQKLPNQIAHPAESVSLFSSIKAPKSEILGSVVAKAASSLPSERGRDTAQGILTCTTSKDLESKPSSDVQTTKSLSDADTSVTTAAAENIQKVTMSVIPQIAAVAIARELWHRRPSQMKDRMLESEKYIDFTKQHRRCSCKTRGRTCEVKGHLRAGTHCLDDKNYTVLQAVVGKFFEAAVRGNQRCAIRSLLNGLEALDKIAKGSGVLEYSLAAVEFLYTGSVLWHRPLFPSLTHAQHGPVVVGRVEPKRLASRNKASTSGYSAGQIYEKKSLDVEPFREKLRTITKPDTIVPELRHGLVYFLGVEETGGEERVLNIEYAGPKEIRWDYS